MKSPILTHPVEVSNRLQAFGFTREQFLEVIAASVAGRNSVTLNDPPGSAGWCAWQQGTRRLREIGGLIGMERDDSDQISCILDRKRNIRIAVANTDEGTGLENSKPINCSKKGAATDRLVSANSMGSFGILWEEARNVISLQPRNIKNAVLWYLCIYSDGDMVRAELSCPTICESGFLREFSERIIILGPEDCDDFVRCRDDRKGGGGEEFEISITRKQS
jgi:hypothetical protein